MGEPRGIPGYDMYFLKRLSNITRFFSVLRFPLAGDIQDQEASFTATL